MVKSWWVHYFPEEKRLDVLTFLPLYLKGYGVRLLIESVMV